MAARKDRERAEARRLRATGRSLREIAIQLDVALSSVSVWVRDVERPIRALAPARVEPLAGPAEPEATRRCSVCARDLPLTAFNRLRDGHQWWCRECFRTYFQRRGDLHRAQTHEARQRRQVAAKKFILGFLATHHCLDCGEEDPVVLEFDHVGAKRDDVSRMVAQGASPRALERELTACEVVCVNCHRRRTARRGRWRRAERDWCSMPCSRLPRERRNLDFAYSMLLASGCVDCSVSDLCILEFDHVSGKRANVTQLAGRGYSTARLVEEIQRCVVRCGNCHRRRTARDGGHYRTLGT